MIPDIECVIEASCMINPSEDPDKVAAAVSNVLAEPEMDTGDSMLVARSRTLASLEKIRQAIHSRQQQKTYGRSLRKNLADKSTRLYFNKQAAFAQRIAICQEADESPLGPITVTISSPEVEKVMGWLVS
ncbi:MAG: hypothetical protein EB829_01485 [Nitrosopumilus sp. H8]|nr:MAG: hypothetical protein EB830_02790 [Nitrosopumilus sp. H13]RNJ79742.1 MAG: hypothetical protein EB829_01485 [Nitrosopumilus sp. H8]